MDGDLPATDRADPDPGTGQQRLPPLGTATWPQVDRSPRRLLLLPLGSTEQHGPHLPLDTDTVIAESLAAHIHRHRPYLGLAPPMPYGASGEHKDFPGTLSIGTEALIAVLVEFVRHASATWEHVLVINGHGGNADALEQAAELMRHEGRSLAVCHAASGGPRADAHAGYRETSIMLHLAPHSVRQDLLAPGNATPFNELIPHLRANGVRAVSANGILGDPTGANAAAGRRIFELMSGAVAARVGRLL